MIKMIKLPSEEMLQQCEMLRSKKNWGRYINMIWDEIVLTDIYNKKFYKKWLDGERMEREDWYSQIWWWAFPPFLKFYSTISRLIKKIIKFQIKLLQKWLVKLK